MSVEWRTGECWVCEYEGEVEMTTGRCSQCYEWGTGRGMSNDTILLKKIVILLRRLLEREDG